MDEVDEFMREAETYTPPPLTPTKKQRTDTAPPTNFNTETTMAETEKKDEVEDAAEKGLFSPDIPEAAEGQWNTRAQVFMVGVRRVLSGKYGALVAALAVFGPINEHLSEESKGKHPPS